MTKQISTVNLHCVWRSATTLRWCMLILAGTHIWPWHRRVCSLRLQWDSTNARLSAPFLWSTCEGIYIHTHTRTRAACRKYLIKISDVVRDHHSTCAAYTHTQCVCLSLWSEHSRQMKVTHMKCGPSALTQQVLSVCRDPSCQFFALWSPIEPIHFQKPENYRLCFDCWFLFFSFFLRFNTLFKESDKPIFCSAL